jgi:dihydrofolate reductase
MSAAARSRVIDQDNRLPWHLPSDIRHFRQALSLAGRLHLTEIAAEFPGDAFPRSVCG